MKPEAQVAAFINPRARGGFYRDHLAALSQQLRQRFPEIQITHWAPDIPMHRWVENISPGTQLVIAAGGDGTVRELAGALIRLGRNDIPLAIIPLGTGNDIATELGVDTIEGALGVAATGTAIQRNAIEIELPCSASNPLHYALLFTCAGPIVRAVTGTTEGLKRRFGKNWAYQLGVLRALPGFRRQPVKIEDENGDRSELTLGVAIGVTEYIGGGSIRLFEKQHLKRDRLSLLDLGALNLVDAAGQLPRLARRASLNHPKISYRTAKEIKLSSPESLAIQADGDQLGWLPATIRLKTNALRLVAPSLKSQSKG